MSFEIKLPLRSFNRLVKNGEVRTCESSLTTNQASRLMMQLTCIYCTRVFIVDGCGFVDVALLGGRRLSVDYK